MSTPNNTDLLLVERGGSQYKLPYSDLNNKLDTDIFLVERDGVQYKVLGEFIGGSGVGVVTAAPVLSDDNNSLAPAVITVTDATVENATLTGTVVLKDGVAIAVATGSSFSATDPGVYTVKQTWTDGLGNTFQVESQLELGFAGGYVDDLFSTFLYEGTNSAKTITNGIDLAGEGGLVWIKSRSQARTHCLWDTERGIRKNLRADENSFESDSGTQYGVQSFNSDGFTLSENWSGENESGAETCSWTFRKARGFFDVVTYTGNGTNQSIAHDLGSAPGCIMIKNRSSDPHWVVYHRGISVPAEKALVLDTSWAEDDDVYFNDTAPTSTHFTVGPKTQTNTNGENYVAYIFAHDDQSFGTGNDESIIKCGSLTISSQATTQVDLGFEPQWVLLKRSDGDSNWFMFDTMRKMDVTGFEWLYANDSHVAENKNYVGVYPTTAGFGFDPVSNGQFTDGNYIYMAIRRPHKPPTAGTEVFTAAYGNGGVEPSFDSNNHTIDFGIYRRPDATEEWYVTNRLTGNKHMAFNKSSPEYSSAINYDYNYGYADGANANYFAYMFRRAPGFLDVVTYTGTSSNRTVNHNLGVVPELFFVKARNLDDGWAVYNKVSGATKFNMLRQYGDYTNEYRWNNTEPTSTAFTVGTDNSVNRTDINYVAYLFASSPGISKIGSYTGTGNEIDVDCGFTTGARFVLIKRIDGELNIDADWYVWDTTRGINGASEPFWNLNTDAPQVTTTDYIDPLISGFKVTASGQQGTNAVGGEYLFLAIA